MRKATLFFFFILAAFAGNAQKKHSKLENLFASAYEQVDDSMYAEAINSYHQIIKATSAHSPLYAKATYNIGYVYKLLKKYDSAQLVFKKILLSSFNEFDKGSGIMGDPYALYKHNTCVDLADIAFYNNDYSAALGYIQDFDKKYPYRHFCGNEMAWSRIFTATMYAKAYIGLGDTAEAIKKLLPEAFYNGLADNNKLLEQLIPLLKNKYDKHILLTELNKALNNITVQREVEGKYDYTYYYINFLGEIIDITNVYSEDFSYHKNQTETESRKLMALNSSFYKKLAE